MFKYLRKYLWAAILAPIFMLGEVFMDLIQPKLLSRIVDEGVLGINSGGETNLNLVINLGLIMIGLVIIGGFCGVMSGVFANIAGQNFGNDLRKDLFTRIMSFSFEQTDEFSTGSLITRVTNDVSQLQSFVQMSIRGFVRTFMLFLGGIVCMLSLNLSFGLVVAISLPLIIICLVYFISRVNPKFSILQKKLDKLNNVMQENVSGSRVVKAYVREDYEIGRFKESNEGLVNTQLDVLFLLSYMNPLMNLILNFSIVAIIKLGQINVMKAAVSPGEVMAAISYISQVLNAVMRMNMIFQTASRGLASAKRVNEVLNCEPSIKDGKFKEETKIKGKIEFKNVSFSYPSLKDELIIKDFNLSINPGETIGILGETGSGKSSLISLIPRFYDINSGKILIDNIDIKDYNLEILRDKIAIALQKSDIFNRTIKDNISWGNDDASLKEIIDVANLAQAYDFIEEKKEGLNSIVSQEGRSLSGGQKQRIAIARALLKKAEIIIFDDATSALDLKTEARLYKALKERYPKTTKIIVAQRIASVMDADRILIIENGSIASIGNHKELLEKSQIYREIYNSQLGATDNAS